MSLDVGRKTDWRDERRDRHWLRDDEDSPEVIDNFYSFERSKSAIANHAERLLTESKMILRYRSIDLPAVKRRCSANEKKMSSTRFLRCRIDLPSIW